MQTVNRSPAHTTFRNGNGEWTMGSTNDSNAATSVFGSIQDIMVRIIQGGDLEFCVCVTSTAKLHQSAFSGLLDKQVRVTFQKIPFHVGATKQKDNCLDWLERDLQLMLGIASGNLGLS